jgi:hypothetical protein
MAGEEDHPLNRVRIIDFFLAIIRFCLTKPLFGCIHRSIPKKRFPCWMSDATLQL